MDQIAPTDGSRTDAALTEGATTDRPFVVGIGASAGGLEALERFFDSLPERPGMAFVVIQHLSPDFKSLMDELLRRHTTLPIQLAENEMRVAVNHVYLIPPRMEMIISGGRLLLSEREPQPELNLPIDVFFRSLARDCGPRGIGIVLSGSGSDGSRGIRDIRDAGGLVLVQDTDSAQFDGMPKTAREAGVAHWVLAPQDMPHVLLEHVKKRATPDPARAAGASGERGGIEAVYQMLEEQFGIDFTHYKPSTITRRIERRLALAQSPHVDEYVRRLRTDRDELDILYRDLLIGVTHFFRDTEAFRLLEEQVLPEILRQEPRHEPVRIWVAGCATGEEAYSLAIVLQDLMQKVGERPVKIFATDVHRGSLDLAARAIYDAESLANVSPERLERYFLRLGESYQVTPDVRKMIVFAQHNVMSDAPFTRVDLVTCRNLLIYLQPAAQAKVLSLFHFALKRGGRLFLGPSETVGTLGPEFHVIDKHWRLYRKEADSRRIFDNVRPPTGHQERRTPPTALGPSSRPSPLQLLGTYDAILDELMPPSLLVSERGELIHSFGGASRFLRVHDGRHDLDLVDMVDPELRLALVGGLKRALEEPNPLVFRGVRQTTDGQARLFDVTLRRFRSRSSGARHVLVSFQQLPGEAPTPVPQPSSTEIEVQADQISRDQLAALEAELTHTRENLQAAIEELESSNEELQAANEELQASNEELQSTNEELQSVNEELYTVNAEYQRKISELTELTNDMDNLLASTEVGTVFLDRQLRIRKFTPQIAETFALLPHDVGRPIETFASKLDHPELVDELRRVLESAQPIERELGNSGGKIFFLRIFPYRAKGTIDGVVLTLIDATGLRTAEDALFHERHLLESLLANLPEAIYFKDAAGKFIRANTAMAKRLGLGTPAELAGRTADDLPEPGLGRVLNQQDELILRTGQPQNYSLEQRADGWDLATRLPIRGPDGRLVGTTAIFRDVTEQKRAEGEIREAVRRRDQFLAMLSHELRNPLSAIVTATGLLGRQETTATQRRQVLEVLSRQVQQMTRLLDELLEASRVTHNKIELKKEIIDINDIVRDALEVARAQIEAHGIHLVTELSTDHLAVDGDAARLQQVLVNLLTNATKYTPSGGHILVTSHTADDHSGMAEIRIRDDGAGIPRELLESVFELFVQSRRTLDRSAGGLGVGLSLVRSLVAMHGGKVSAHSAGEGQGSEFVVRLPLAGTGTAREDAASDGHEESDDQDSHDGHDGHANPTGPVLLVEDNADNREMLCELLRLSGVRCTAFESATAALAALDDVRPRAAIIDLGLPEMDGFELARRIRAQPVHGKILLVALTGYGQPSDRSRSRQAGFDEHLVKPVRIERLLAVLGRRPKMLDGVRDSDGGAAAATNDRPLPPPAE